MSEATENDSLYHVETMYEYTKRIREFINEPKKQHVLLKNRDLWSQLCSCLDVIEDSQLAIDAHSTTEFGTSDGANYLGLYGLLQALFLQQDAVINLCESLKIPETIDNYPRLKEIREIRNDSIGHPTKRNRRKDKLTSYHFISRSTLCPTGFELLSTYSNGKVESKKISIPEVIADQNRYVSGILNSIVTKLEEEEKAHKEEFRMEKLMSILPDYLHYELGKLREGTRKKERAPQGQLAVQHINQTLQIFRQALEKRGIEVETYDSIKYLYDVLEYPLSELGSFFQSVNREKEPNINEKTAYIFADFVIRKVEELIQIAQEIDEDYAS